MKKKLLFLSIIVVIVFFALGISLYYHINRLSSDILIIEPESYFSDYEVKDQKVHLYCHVVIKNKNDDGKYVQLVASFPKDYKRLLSEKEIWAMNDNDIQTIYLEGNSSSAFDVEFIGNYAGIETKYDRLLPNIKIKEVPADDIATNQ